MSTTALTREQKLMAEQVVQLGNIAEAIRAAAMGENSSTLMEEIQSAQSTTYGVDTSNVLTCNQLLLLHTAQVAELQTQLNNID